MSKAVEPERPLLPASAHEVEENPPEVGDATADPAPVARTAWHRRASPLGVLGLVVVLTLLCFWPGHMSGDTLTQIGQAQTGDVTNHHAPVLVWLWSLVFDAGVGPGWAFTLQVVTFVAGTYLILRAALRPLTASLVTGAISFAPPVFGMLGYLSRDTLFASMLLMTFGLLVSALRATDSRTARRYAIGVAIFAWFALATRQNAAAGVAIALVVGAGYLIVRRWGAGRVRGRARVVVASCAAGFAVTLAMMATIAGFAAVIGTEDVDPEQYLYVYDVAAMSMHEGENLFPPEAMPDGTMEGVRAAWNVDSMLAYQFLPQAPMETRLPPPAVEALADSWRDAVTGDPLAYLDARIDLFARQIGLTREAMWIYHPVIDANGFGYQVVFDGPNRIARDYVEAFAANPDTLDGTFIHKPWPYLLIALLGAILWLRRGADPALLVVGALALASLTYQVGLFFGAMGTQYRFQFPSVVIGLIVLAIGLQRIWARRAARVS